MSLMEREWLQNVLHFHCSRCKIWDIIVSHLVCLIISTPACLLQVFVRLQFGKLGEKVVSGCKVVFYQINEDFFLFY